MLEALSNTHVEAVARLQIGKYREFGIDRVRYHLDLGQCQE